MLGKRDSLSSTIEDWEMWDSRQPSCRKLTWPISMLEAQWNARLEYHGYPCVKLDNFSLAAIHWCQTNLPPGSFRVFGNSFWFDSESDAFVFRMTWA